jgi:adenylylsulfate reductase subunit B
MSIAIDKSKCIGCQKCRNVCPGTLIKMDDNGKAYIKYPKDCWGCTSCIKECPVYAIDFYLGADVGGMGSKVHTEKQGDILHWIIKHPNGDKTQININQKESNKY